MHGTARAPLVTIYVTNHNYGRFVRQSVESVLAQTLGDFELLIIDDGSTDDSRKEIERFADDPRVQVIYQHQQGLNRTNNIALRAARGRYLVRLDADDYLDPNALMLLSGALDRDPELGLVFPDYYVVDADGHVIRLERRHAFHKEVSLYDQPAHGACTMIRRQFLLDVGGYDEGFSCQDGYDLWVKFVSRYKVSNINLPLFYYRQHGSNLTKNEDRILSTRTGIKEAFVRRNNAALTAWVVIPVRGAHADADGLAMRELGGRRVIDWSIRAALEARRVDRVLVVSSDEDVRGHVKVTFAGEGKVEATARPEELERLNVSADDTLRFVLDRAGTQPEALVMLSMQYPFMQSRYIDDAINTLAIFNADSVVSVRPETAILYRHDGAGLEPILDQERFTQLERDALYRHAGGLYALRPGTLDLRARGERERRSHVVIDARAAQGIRTAFDFELARFLCAGSSGSVVGCLDCLVTEGNEDNEVG